MILESVNTTLTNASIDAYPLMGDVEANCPFCVFSNQQKPVKTKDGINGYQNNLVVTCLAESVAECVTLSGSVKSAVLAMTGTINSTSIESVEFVGGDPFFDDQLQIVRADLEFLIDTKNI